MNSNLQSTRLFPGIFSCKAEDQLLSPDYIVNSGTGQNTKKK
jgi:hypothetical protein